MGSIIRKKGQEEMVGFVLIIIVVAVIFLIFLGIFVRRGGDTERVESNEVAQFLAATMRYTTECSLNGYSYIDVDSLIRECSAGTRCVNSEKACDMLKETMKGLVENSWNFGPNSPEKNYYLTVLAESGSGNVQQLIPGLGNTCTGSKRGADVPLGATGSVQITVTLELCLS